MACGPLLCRLPDHPVDSHRVTLSPHHPPHPRCLELLAPAGDLACLDAALQAGADAVYFGLGSLNARRRADNIRARDLADAVARAHAHHAKVYLTLNVDLAQQDIQTAARMLQFACQCSVDAVIVKDAALLALAKHFPQLALHLSTQCGITSSADVRAAAVLSARRVVLAREMTLAEIAAASAVEGIETEVFVQGAHCFGVSGRCLLSSWTDGRSANRGLCSSPCRQPWSSGEACGDTPFSMLDLSLAHRLADLAMAGVTAVKIEGRLKTADWVRQAVTVYRHALDGADQQSVADRVADLGRNTGRAMTSGFLDGRRDELVGLSRRQATATVRPRDKVTMVPGPPDFNGYELSIACTPDGFAFRCIFGGRATEQMIPRQSSPGGATTTLGQILARLQTEPIESHPLKSASADSSAPAPAGLLGKLRHHIGQIIRRTPVPTTEQLDVVLPQPILAMLAAQTPHASNIHPLGQRPDRVRLSARQLQESGNALDGVECIVEGTDGDWLGRLPALRPADRTIIALPPVLFEDQLSATRRLIERCSKLGLRIEANNWGGWWLARIMGARIEAGPGLAVPNSLAARKLGSLGIECVTASVEADRLQLEALTATCSVPLSVVIFGQPVLMISRVEMPPRYEGRRFRDLGGTELISRQENGLWCLRPEQPFDLRGQDNPRIRAAHFVVDLTGSPDPVAEWRSPHPNVRRFNYDRVLI